MADPADIPDPNRRRFLGATLATSASMLAGCSGQPRPHAQEARRRTATPLEHLIVVHRENHSYDNYFGSFPGGNGTVAGDRGEDDQPNPPHSRAAALRGSCTTDVGNCHYLEQDIPNYFAYAREYTLCDNYFGEILGPSIPNYFGMMATKTPVLYNPRHARGKFDLPNITTQLTAAGVSWKNYDAPHGLPLVALFKDAVASGNIVPLDTFREDARAGRLPAVSWLTPHIRDSEHPSHGVKRGENWAVRHINMVMNSPVWNKCAIIVFWDEWGGFRDHVTPPVIERDGKLPLRLGYRVPCLVISPYARRGHISHTQHSHVSVTATIERTFGAKPLNWRDAGAHDLFDCFDFNQTPRPPLILTERA
ncbi:MAG TPA: alkaline phosphatase family protein [Burkholderiales bacterium]|nr:alkaline phosphatase family protein [Burkholderiales bacterium]